MPKIYTKTGDQGETALNGRRVSKGDPIIGVLGQIDSFSVKLGFLLHHVDDLTEEITEIQQFLIELGSVVAGYTADDQRARRITILLEAEIDVMSESLPELKNFVLPQGNLAVLAAHDARTACRSMEHKLLKTMPASTFTVVVNRLSDWLFIWARKLSEKELAFQQKKGTWVV